MDCAAKRRHNADQERSLVPVRDAVNPAPSPVSSALHHAEASSAVLISVMIVEQGVKSDLADLSGLPPQVLTPEGMAALDLDTIRLTAQFVARNGKAFLTGLASKEHGNPHFNFLKPTNSFFGFFTALCDAYSKVLMPPKDLAEKLRKTSEDRCACVDQLA